MTSSSPPDLGLRQNGSGTASPQTPTDEVVITRSEERLHIGTVQVPVTRVRVRKQIVTETRTVTIEVSREELVIEHESIDNQDGGAGDQHPPPAPQVLDIVLYEQRPVITTGTVPVERIRVRTHMVTQDQSISETVGKEQIELHQDPATPDLRAPGRTPTPPITPPERINP